MRSSECRRVCTSVLFIHKMGRLCVLYICNTFIYFAVYHLVLQPLPYICKPPVYSNNYRIYSKCVFCDTDITVTCKLYCTIEEKSKTTEYFEAYPIPNLWINRVVPLILAVMILCVCIRTCV